jgi:hypothetical protein
MAVDFSDPWMILGYILLGAILGMIGQGIRVIVGIKKAWDEAAAEDSSDEWLNLNKILVSLLIALVIGGIAGALGILTYIDMGGEISMEDIGILIGFGYAGTDFIEGFMKSKMPS